MPEPTEHRPSLEPYIVRQRSPELLRAAEDAFRAAHELEQAYLRTWGVR